MSLVFSLGINDQAKQVVPVSMKNLARAMKEMIPICISIEISLRSIPCIMI